METFINLPADKLTDVSSVTVTFGPDYIMFRQDNDFIVIPPEAFEILKLEMAVRYD